ncbi:MAG: hypothetical protein V2A74_01780 [bacterium]
MSAWNILLWVVMGLCLVLGMTEFQIFRRLRGASRERRIRGRVRLMRRMSGIVLLLIILTMLGLEGWLAGPDATLSRKLLYFGVCFVLAGLLIAFALWDLRATSREALRDRIDLAEESLDLLARYVEKKKSGGHSKRPARKNGPGKAGQSCSDSADQ